MNGGGGVLFNDRPTMEAIVEIGAAHRRFGTTGFLPTLISDDLDKVDAAMRAVEQAIDAGAPGVVGIHLEGPFLSAARKGVHGPSKFRRLDATAIASLSSLRAGKTLVTPAPEECEIADIMTLAAAGVIVAAGHSNATYCQMVGAFAAGVTGVTHLYNAMSPFRHRAPGVVGAALENRSVYCGIIPDGRHVDPAAMRIAVNVRPRDWFTLVTDAMPSVGSAEDSFVLQGKPIRVVDGVCVDQDGVPGYGDGVAQHGDDGWRDLGGGVGDGVRRAGGFPPPRRPRRPDPWSARGSCLAGSGHDGQRSVDRGTADGIGSRGPSSGSSGYRPRPDAKARSVAARTCSDAARRRSYWGNSAESQTRGDGRPNWLANGVQTCRLGAQ